MSILLEREIELLEPGSVNFNLPGDSCFILIAPFDLFGRGLYQYTFEGVCRECPDLRLEDGAVKIFINTQGTNKEEFSQEFLDFMEYPTKPVPNSWSDRKKDMAMLFRSSFSLLSTVFSRDVSGFTRKRIPMKMSETA